MEVGFFLLLHRVLILSRSLVVEKIVEKTITATKMDGEK
jgi:hypothetical protein